MRSWGSGRVRYASQGDNKSTPSAISRAMRHNTTSLALQDAAYDEEPQAQARNLPLYVSPHTIKPAKDPAQFSRRNPDALIGNLNLNPALS